MIAIIPARGGSKGLPGKNIRPLLGKELIIYTIDAAKQSKYIDDIIISTDNSNIADLCVKHGAICPFLRPQELATDQSLAIDNYIYTINRLKNDYGYEINDFIVLQPTSPLRTAFDIDNAIQLYFSKKADSVISYTQEHHPISWHKYIDNNGKFIDIFENHLKNRQEIRTSYYPNGAIYIFKYDMILQHKYYSKNSYAYIMPRNRSVDIDTIDDFEYAEFLLRKKHEK